MWVNRFVSSQRIFYILESILNYVEKKFYYMKFI